MIRSAIRDKIRMQLGETTAAFWTDAQLNTWINDSIRDIAWRLKSLKKTAYMAPTVDTSEYTLSSIFTDLYSVNHMYFQVDGEDWVKLDYIDRDDLDLDYPGWMNAESGIPTKYGYDKEQDWLLIWPPPASDQINGSCVRCFYNYKPTDLTSDSSTPQIPEVLHDTIVEGVKAAGYESRGLGDRANNSRSIYLANIKDYLVERENEPDETIIMRTKKCR